MPDLEPVLLTERCRLRALHHDDAVHVWEASRFPGFTDGMLWNPPEHIDEIHAFTDTKLSLWGTEEYCFTIEDRHTGQFLGRITLRSTGKPREWDIGYFLHPKAWGKGYMTEAVREILRFAFEDLAAACVLSGHVPWNERSKKVLLRAGFRHIGESHDKIFKNGKPVHELEYHMTREEFVRQK